MGKGDEAVRSLEAKRADAMASQAVEIVELKRRIEVLENLLWLYAEEDEEVHYRYRTVIKALSGEHPPDERPGEDGDEAG